MEVFYRYQETYWTEYRASITLIEYPVLKHTPQGVWINLYGGLSKRFIRTTATKQFAHETKEKALESYYARKKRQVSILKAQLRRAESALKAKPDETYYVDFLGDV